MKSFFNFPSTTETRLTELENKFNHIQLMYKPPNSSQHVNITQAFDEIYNKISVIEDRLGNIEDLHYDCGK